LEGLLGAIITVKPSAEAIAQLRLLEVETKDGLGELEKWHDLDAAVHSHPKHFRNRCSSYCHSLIAPRLGTYSKLVLACGDVSL